MIFEASHSSFSSKSKKRVTSPFWWTKSWLNPCKNKQKTDKTDETSIKNIAHKYFVYLVFQTPSLLAAAAAAERMCGLTSHWWRHTYLPLPWSQESLATAPEDSLKPESALNTSKISVAGCLQESDTSRSAVRRLLPPDRNVLWCQRRLFPGSLQSQTRYNHTNSIYI